MLFRKNGLPSLNCAFMDTFHFSHREKSFTDKYLLEILKVLPQNEVQLPGLPSLDCFYFRKSCFSDIVFLNMFFKGVSFGSKECIEELKQKCESFLGQTS